MPPQSCDLRFLRPVLRHLKSPCTPFFTSAFLWLLWHVTPATGTEVRSHTFAGQTETSDVQFTEHLLFSSPVASHVKCAVSCSWVDNCLFFTFSGNEQPGVCQGHSKVMNLADVKVTQVGAVSFALVDKGSEYFAVEAEDWLHRNCSSDADCGGAANVTCFKNRCLCTPGIYFSESLRQCVAECPVSSLSTNFTLYPDSSLDGYNMGSQCSGTVEQCLQTCVDASTFTCRNMEWNYGASYGNFHDVTVLQADPGYWVPDDPGWNFYQRNCL